MSSDHELLLDIHAKVSALTVNVANLRSEQRLTKIEVSDVRTTVSKHSHLISKGSGVAAGIAAVGVVAGLAGTKLAAFLGTILK